MCFELSAVILALILLNFRASFSCMEIYAPALENINSAMRRLCDLINMPYNRLIKVSNSISLGECVLALG